MKTAVIFLAVFICLGYTFVHAAPYDEQIKLMQERYKNIRGSDSEYHCYNVHNDDGTVTSTCQNMDDIYTVSPFATFYCFPVDGAQLMCRSNDFNKHNLIDENGIPYPDVLQEDENIIILPDGTVIKIDPDLDSI